MAIAPAGRRADGKEDGIRPRHRLFQRVTEMQAAIAGIIGHEAVQPGLIDRNPALAQGGDLAGIAVQQPHIHAEFGKAGRGDKADIAGTNNGDMHGLRPSPSPAQL